jgi:hypothetical protein
MMRTNLWSKSVPRVELDQRSRTARLRIERIDRLLIRPAAVTHSRLRRLLGLFSAGIYGSAPQDGRTRGPLSEVAFPHARNSRGLAAGASSTLDFRRAAKLHAYQGV